MGRLRHIQSAEVTKRGGCKIKRFQHQTCSDIPNVTPHQLVRPDSGPDIESNAFCHRMRETGHLLHSRGVRAIYLAHDSVSNDDTLATLSHLAREFPSHEKAFRRVLRHAIDSNRCESGNYTARFAREFASALNGSARTSIPVRRFDWSTEKHHLGRADGAVRLIDELTSREWEPGSRVLLWGHCHAGNVFALMTHLLAGDRRTVEEFFSAAEIYYRWPVVGCVDIPVWHRVKKLLLKNTRPLDHVSLDMVTFGTPICYRWDSAGYASLLHFIYHRPENRPSEYRTVFPPKLEDILNATEGDFLQQLGIADANVQPSLFAWRARLAERRLNRLLQPVSPKGKPVDPFHTRANMPTEGTSLLVDYGPPEGDIATHHAGNAVYTSPKWILFHTEEITRRCYQADVRKVA